VASVIPLERPVTLITGASSGIGRAFARELARRGHNLILVARNRERLQALADQLSAQYSARVEVITADLAQGADVAKVEARLLEPPGVAMLINNAGFGIGRRFMGSETALQEQMIQVHVVAPMRLVRAALPSMIAAQRGAIINVSSVLALLPSPRNATYGASKAFLNSFSESLQLEVAQSGIKVQALCPGLTRTEFHERAGMASPRAPRWLWMDAAEVAEASLAALASKRVVVVPGAQNRCLVALARAVPRPLLHFALRRSMRLDGRQD
jgi:uncharacterized protein